MSKLTKKEDALIDHMFIQCHEESGICSSIKRNPRNQRLPPTIPARVALSSIVLHHAFLMTPEQVTVLNLVSSGSDKW